MERRKPVPAPIPEPETTPAAVIQVEEEPKRWYHNKGKTFRITKNRIIKPGQTFQAYPWEVPAVFSDIIVEVGAPKSAAERAAEVGPAPVSGKPPKKPLPLSPVEVVKSTYSVSLDEATGGWNVVDSQGKIVSEAPIHNKLEAESLAKSLSN